MQQVILTDAVGFDVSTVETVCLSEDPTVFSLDIDSTEIDLNSDFFFQLRNNTNGEFISQLPLTAMAMTGSGSTFVTFPSAGEFSIRAQGFTVDGCSIDEEIIVCLLYTSPSPRDQRGSRMPSSA